MPLIDLNGLGHFKDKENEMIAADYSATKTYAVGDYVYYNGVLKRCIIPITTAEAYTAAHWANAVLAGDVTELKTALTGFEEVDLTSIPKNRHVINSSNKWDRLTSSSPGRACVYAVPTGAKKVTITAKSNVGTVIAWLNSYIYISGTTPDFSENYQGRISVNAGQTIEYDVKSDMLFLFVYCNNSTGGDITPTITVSYIKNISGDTYFPLNPNSYSVNAYAIGSNNKWQSGYLSTLIPRNEDWNRIRIKADSVDGTVIALLKDNSITTRELAHFSDSYQTRISVAPDDSFEFEIPVDTQYIYVLLSTSSSSDLTTHITMSVSYKNNENLELENFESLYNYPNLYNSGEGIPATPYASDDGTAGMAKTLYSVGYGGKLHVYNGVYNITNQIVINGRNINIEGDTWNYPADPNGVYPSNTGTKFALLSDEIPSVFYSASDVSGMRISQIGIQGLTTTWDTSDASGNDSSYYFSPSDIKNVGYYFGNSGRIDQCKLNRISFCGLAVGILAKYTIDANVWSELNTDGCDFGIFVDYNTCHHPKIINNITSDCTGCGIFYKTTAGDNSYGLVASGNVLVRNASYLTAEQIAYGIPQASLCLIGHKYASICENTIVLSGTYKRTSGDGIPYTGGIGLYFSGSYSVISNNKISDSTEKAAEISGDNNSITGNMIKDVNDGVVINGDNNIVSGNMLDSVLSVTGDNNKIQQNVITGNITLSGDNNIIEGDPSNTITVSGNNNILVGFAAANVTDNGTGTVIK